jgi:hypothetical protein
MIRLNAYLIKLSSISILLLEPKNAKIIKRGMNTHRIMLQTRTTLAVETSLDQKKRATVRKKKKITMVQHERRPVQISKDVTS